MDTKTKVAIAVVGVVALAGAAWALSQPVASKTSQTSTTVPNDTVSLVLSTSTTALTVTLTATATSSIGATTVINSIDWGDGNSASSAVSPATHTYSSAGTYTITVKASDANVPVVSATTTVTTTAPVTSSGSAGTSSGNTGTTGSSTGGTNTPGGAGTSTSTGGSTLGTISNPYSGSVQTGGPNYNWQGAGYYMFNTYGPVDVTTQATFDSYENALAKLGSIPSDIIIGNEDGSWSDQAYPYMPTNVTVGAVTYASLTWNGTGYYYMSGVSSYQSSQSAITDWDTASYNAALAGTTAPVSAASPGILGYDGSNQITAGTSITFNVSGLTANSTWKLWVCPVVGSGTNKGTPVVPIVPSTSLTAAQNLSGTGAGSLIYDVTVGSPFYNNINTSITPNCIAVVAVDSTGKLTNAVVFDYSA